jgi:eukaryotic-like serine/threonine-protein kinase
VTLTAGTRIGPYEIVGALGQGGMGEVYRARDPRLGREVAIKVSAERFSDRFEREARAIAALNHPNICTLYDVGPDYLVMELVEGPTLADRIQSSGQGAGGSGGLDLVDALDIARQIAVALQAAHDKGIVHRDLKPANVKITPDGVVKVLDFGLAKLAEPNASDENPENSPTMTAHPVTRAGLILGTSAYMAPEQARGNPVDKRADIWAFGVVLYEMLSGDRLFHRDTVSDTLAAVLTKEPVWDRVPPKARPLLQRCLVKDPRRRLRDIGDIDLLLDGAPELVSSASRRRPWLAWGAAALLLVALAPAAFLHLREQAAVAEPVRFEIPVTVNLSASGVVALSPDGRQLAFAASDADGVLRLFVRAMDSLEVRPLMGSEISTVAPPPFWSPDSRFIAFDAGGKLKKLDVSGGPAQTLCDLPGIVVGGSWNRDGDIIVGSTSGGLLRVSESGGAVSPVTALDPSRKEGMHLLPSFLPDGRHFVYLRLAESVESSGIYVGSLDAKPEEQGSKQILPYVIGLTYAPPTDSGPGRLLFLREGTLMAQPFDARRLALAGDAVPVAQQVGSFRDSAFFSISSNGVLAYRATDRDFQLTWFDRQGSVLGRVSDPGRLRGAALSPDGTRAMASRTNPQDSANSDLWLLDLLQGNRATRFTSGTGIAEFPVWSPDGTRIAFTLQGNVFQKLASGAKDEELVQLERGRLKTPTSWSPDGRFLLIAAADPISRFDLWVLPLQGDRTPVPFARTRFDENQGRFSPDGRWVAYVSNESGASEVYVKAFDKDFAGGSASAGGSTLVSKDGGTAPRWRGDGKELFYLAPNGTMMAVDLTINSAFQAGTPTPLFQAPSGATVGDASADGKRFLLVTPIGPSASAPFTVVLNWTAGLKK